MGPLVWRVLGTGSAVLAHVPAGATGYAAVDVATASDTTASDVTLYLVPGAW